MVGGTWLYAFLWHPLAALRMRVFSRRNWIGLDTSNYSEKAPSRLESHARTPLFALYYASGDIGGVRTKSKYQAPRSYHHST